MQGIRSLSKHNSVLAEVLDFEQVFLQGLTIHAWSVNRGLRIVNFVDTLAHYDSIHSGGKRPDHVALGKGANIDVALKRALDCYIFEQNHDEYYADKKIARSLYKKSSKTTSQLDYWILHHCGTMFSKLGEDGQISTVLEGWNSTDEANRSWITLMGKGQNLYESLTNSFSSSPWRAPKFEPVIRSKSVVREKFELPKDFFGSTDHLPTAETRKNIMREATGRPRPIVYKYY